MAVVRLEIDVPDELADDLADEVSRRYVRISALPDGWRSATVRVVPDAEVRRDRDIMRALSHFLPGV